MYEVYHLFNISNYFFNSKSCIRSSFVTTFYSSVTVIMLLIAGSKKLSAVAGGFVALIIWWNCTERCDLAFTEINEWMTFPVITLLICMPSFKSFVFEICVLFRMAKKIGWFHPFIGYVFITKYMMIWVMTQSQWTFLACHTHCVFVLCFEFVQHGPKSILLILAANWHFNSSDPFCQHRLLNLVINWTWNISQISCHASWLTWQHSPLHSSLARRT